MNVSTQPTGPAYRDSPTESILDGDDGSDGDDQEGLSPKGKGGRKKDPKTQQLRKVQNRIAQREFRQRKQQYIRDLEARVELFSASRDEQVDQLRVGLRALTAENKELRRLLKQLAAFVGDGLGGKMHQLGLDAKQFQTLLGKADTDTVYDALQSNKGQASNSEVFANNTSNGTASQNAESSTGRKRKRPSLDDDTIGNRPPSSGSQFRSGDVHSAPDAQGTFGDESRPRSPRPVPPKQPGSQHTSNGPEHSHPQPAPVELSQGPPSVMEIPDVQPLYGVCTDEPKLQALQLISYHMKNKRRNPAYHLPPAFIPTRLQETVAHEGFIDGIIWHSLRDRLILCQNQYDMSELFDNFVEACKIHSEDILDPSSWELAENFLRKYWFLVDESVLACCNRWRRDRNEPELTVRDLIPKSAEMSAIEALTGQGQSWMASVPAGMENGNMS